MKKCWLFILIFFINLLIGHTAEAKVNLPFLRRLKERQLATEFKRGKQKNDVELQAAVIQIATEKGYDDLIRRLTAEDVIRVLKKLSPEQQSIIEKIVDILAERSQKELEEIYNELRGSPSGQAFVESMQKSVTAGEFPVAKLPAGVAPPPGIPAPPAPGIPVVPALPPEVVPPIASAALPPGVVLPGAPPAAPSLPGIGPGIPGAPIVPRVIARPKPVTLPPIDLTQLSQKEKNLSDLRILQTLDDVVQVDALGKTIEGFSKKVVDLFVEKLAKNEGFKKRKELGILTGKRFEQADEMDAWYQQETGNKAENEKEIDDYLMQNSLAVWIKNNYTSLPATRQAITRAQLQADLAKMLVSLVFDVDVINQDARYHIEYFVVTAAEPLRSKEPSTLSLVARSTSNRRARVSVDVFKNILLGSKDISEWVGQKDISNVQLNENYVQNFFIAINRLRLDNVFKPNLVVLSGREKNAIKNIDRLLGEAAVNYARGLRGLDQEYYAPLLTGSIVGGGSKLIRSTFIGKLARQLFFVESIKDAKILPNYKGAELIYQNIKDKHDGAEQLVTYFSGELNRINFQLDSIKLVESGLEARLAKEQDEEEQERLNREYQEIRNRRQALERKKTEIIPKEQQAKEDFNQAVESLQRAKANFEKAKADYDDIVQRFEIVLADYNNKIDKSVSQRLAKANFSLAIIDVLNGIQKFPELRKRFEKLAREKWVTEKNLINISALIAQLQKEPIAIDNVVKLLTNLIDEEDREQGKEAIAGIVALFKAYEQENVQFLFIRDELGQAVAQYKESKQPVFGQFYIQVKNKYGNKWGTSDRTRRFLENLYRVPDSDLMSIGISPEEAQEVRMKGGNIKDLFLKKFNITEQDVWNMLEPYGILFTIFNKAVSTRATLQDVIGSLKLALGIAKDDPSIKGEVEDINSIIQLHKKYRLSPEMASYNDSIRNVIIKNLEIYKVNSILQVLQELVQNGHVISEKNPELKLLNKINEHLVTAVIQEMRLILTNVLKGTAEQIAGIVFDEEKNLNLFAYLNNNENIRLLLSLIPGSFMQLKNGQYIFEQEKFNDAVQAILDDILKQFGDRFSHEVEQLNNYFGVIGEAIADLVVAAKMQYN